MGWKGRVKATESDRLFDEAVRVLPGGVSSPVRAFGAVGGRPRFMARGAGSRLTDVDGNEYIDLVMSWGPLIHGHAHPAVGEAINGAVGAGTTFGAATEIELRLAESIQSCLPSVEMLRFVSSGTEATMSATRLARAFTGRDLLIKFDGCYHGHVDALLIQAGSGALTNGRPTSAGIPPAVTSRTRGLPYNDLASLRRLMDAEGDQIAAVIVEPVAGNMGTVPPREGFLELLREETDRHGALLIFDEVITGFRLGLTGAQGRFGIKPDLTCLGKIIGGGLPAAAFGGRADLMRLVSPSGPVYQAGTLSGNPVAMAAGLASLNMLRRADYARLGSMAGGLAKGLRDMAARLSIPLTVNECGPMLSPFFQSGPVTDLTSAQRSDTTMFGRFFQAMLERGIYLPPSQFETWMLSFAHTDDDVDTILAALLPSLEAARALISSSRNP